MVVIAVLRHQVHAGRGHARARQAELSRRGLVQPQHGHRAFGHDLDPAIAQYRGGRGIVGEQEMPHAAPVNHPCATAFDADARLAERARHACERAGAIRDIFQNHLLQLLALTAMEPPIDFTAEAVRNEKVKVLRAMHTPGPKSVVRGQYGRGFVDGEEVASYREEPGVDSRSLTETYVAAKLYVDNWRWADTPFYVRAGKRLARRETTIAIQFKQAPHPPFEAIAGDGLRPNVLVVHVQPDEGVSLAIGAKVPGAGMSIRTVHMDFLYGGAFREGVPEAYERLILDAMLGDQTLFTREDEVEEQWKLVDAMVGAWSRDRPSFPNYAAGSWGPALADELLHRDGRSWRRH